MSSDDCVQIQMLDAAFAECKCSCIKHPEDSSGLYWWREENKIKGNLITDLSNKRCFFSNAEPFK